MLYRSAIFAGLSAIASAQLQLLYQFPSQPYTNIENVAIRKNNQLLLNIATGPMIYQLDPSNPNPQLLITIPGPYGSNTGIAETWPGSDVFAVASGNFTFGPQVPGGVAGVPGSFAVSTVDLSGGQAVASQVAAIPEASSLNGATAVPGSKHTVLVADSGLGAIWSVNLKTGSYQIAAQDPLFAPTADNAIGINGIHIRNGVLYYTNSGQRSFGKISIGYGKDGSVMATSSAQTIATTGTEVAFDDFSFNKQGTAYIAAQTNALYMVSPSGQAALVAGGGNDTTLASPTSTVFDYNGCTLYIVTGGVAYPPGSEISGQVFSYNTCTGQHWVA